MKIFLLFESGYEGTFFIDAYSTKEKALQRLEDCITKRFAPMTYDAHTMIHKIEEYRSELNIDEYELDKGFTAHLESLNEHKTSQETH